MRTPAMTGFNRDALRNAGAYVAEFATPTLRLGVTGLARAGKTVFITALVRNLLEGGRLPFFAARSQGRIGSTYLEPQPDDDLPRFDYETHLAALSANEPSWPQSTSQVSQLRLTIDYQPSGTLRRMLGRALGASRLHIDIIDYPGEWLIDLGLLHLDYATWSAEALAAARKASRSNVAAGWLNHVQRLDPAAPLDETQAREAAAAFTGYLQAARTTQPVATLGPGRFLMPGELAGSPLLTFVPLDIAPGVPIKSNSLAAAMQRRFESYKRHVAHPFFRDHFSRLDRQIVLVDALAAIDGGPDAIEDLTSGLAASLQAFRPGLNSWLSQIMAPRVDRILFAATKADHLPRSSHDRLEAALGLITERAASRAVVSGAQVKVLAMAALRATRDAEARQGSELLPCIAGRPLAGEKLGATVFDGRTEAVVFPGDLPADPSATLTRSQWARAFDSDVRVIRFAPPRLPSEAATIEPQAWPHIRLDRAIEFLIGDRLI